MNDSNTHFLSYKYRIYPNQTQKTMLDRAMSIGWRIYNDALHQRIQHYKETGTGLTWQTQSKMWRQYRNQHEELQILPSETMTLLIQRLDKAYQAFFKRRKDGVGFPKSKKRVDFTGLDYRYGSKGYGAGCKFTFTDPKRAKLYLMNVGEIKVHAHRQFPEGARIKQLTVNIEKDDTYWVSVKIEIPNTEIPVHTGEAVGIDIGMHYLIALSNGDTLDNPRWYRNKKRIRRVIQRKFNRQMRANNPNNFNEDKTVKKGVFIWKKSNRQRNTLHDMRKLESKVSRQRSYFWNNVTDYLTKTYSMIALEDLTLDFMIKNRKLSMSAHDASFGMFWRMLEYKAKRTGTTLVWVDPKYTSQTCPKCGCVSKENRKTQANFTCVECGYKENADIVAAKNILVRAWVSLQ